MSMSSPSSEASPDTLGKPADTINGEDGGGGLFGSDSENEGSGRASYSNKRRRLDDSELDSGDDEGREEKLKDGLQEEEENGPERTAVVTDIAIGQHPGPLPSDGELYLLQFPKTVGLNPKAFTLEGFEPPGTDHHSLGPPSTAFSAFGTSNSTIRWRDSPKTPSLIQSNARINRWSDGSLTLQLGSNAREQFELTARPLAQPQTHPKKPTPTSTNSDAAMPATYNPRLDSHTYLAAPHEHAGLMRHTHHVTASLTVQSAEQDDDALLRLQQGLAAAARGNKATADGGVEVINISEDPENAKRRAELAEKEKVKMQRRYQIQQDRENTRANNVLKRSGLRTGGMGAGLTVGGLEDDEGMMAARARKAKPKARRNRRRNSEYSDDEDYRGRAHNKEDEYDEDDGFLVNSDEEPEVGEDSEEEEEELDGEGDDDEERVDQTEKAKAAERTTDASGGARVKRRRVIEDEDEE